MMRALWTGATGMVAQQDAIDTISNNLSNVNTTGYKKETVEFKTLLYSKLQTKTTDNNGNAKPVIGQVGAGVRTASVTSRYSQGAINPTGNTYDFALEGNGFFQVLLPDGSVGYTRNGAFNMSIGAEGLTLCTSEGYPILNTDGEPLVFEGDMQASRFLIDDEGNFFYNQIKEVIVPNTENTENTENAEGAENQEQKEPEKKLVEEQINLGVRFGIVQFSNPAGLFKLSNSVLSATESSGEAMAESENTELKMSKVMSGYLESSNVETVDEMVNLIVAQRAYEMNSKVITATNEMLQQANNLRG